jgi:hypothetical protein
MSVYSLQEWVTMSTPSKKYVIYDVATKKYIRTDSASEDVAFQSISVGGESGPILSAFSGNFSLNGNVISNSGDPLDDNDLATKEYVDTHSNATPWLDKTGAYTASAFDRILINSISSSFTITLPPSPTFGDEIIIADAGGYLTINSVTIASNGNNIAGLAQNFIMDENNTGVRLTYYNSSRGWSVNPA